MKTIRKIIDINEELCDGCGQCVISCAEGAIRIIDGKAKVISDNLCDGLGACIGECPNDALKIIEREADEFDEEAVEEHLDSMASEENTSGKSTEMACGGCPSAQIKTFEPCPGSAVRTGEATSSRLPSALTHWPVQIRLVPPNAPFLKGADLLVLADCVAVAYPNLHADLLAGKAVMMGCPKFDDVNGYIDKFAQVFQQAGLKSVTVVTMEVPCCSGLPYIVKKAMEAAGTHMPVREIVISGRGEILSDTHADAAPAAVCR